MLEELVSKIHPNDLVGLAAVVLGILAGLLITVTAIVAGSVRRYRERKMTIALVQDLLDRGLAPDEVERLVVASGGADPADLKEKGPNRPGL